MTDQARAVIIRDRSDPFRVAVPGCQQRAGRRTIWFSYRIDQIELDGGMTIKSRNYDCRTPGVLQ